MRHLLSLAAALFAVALPATAHAQYENPFAIIQTFRAPTNPDSLTLRRLTLGDISAQNGNIFGLYAWNGNLTGRDLFRVAPVGPIASFTEAPNLLLTPGALYAFAWFPPNSTATFSLAPGSVAGGNAYACSDGLGCIAYTSGIPAVPASLSNFSVTFGSPAPVVTPEPVTLTLTLGGLVVLGGMVRRRRA